LNCHKIQNELGWRPKIPLEAGLRQTIDWYKENKQWLDNVRAGEYRSYYAKYYENRDSSLHAIAESGASN
jgi:dTDP-glucose 4,6-dehydratase